MADSSPTRIQPAPLCDLDPFCRQSMRWSNGSHSFMLALHKAKEVDSGVKKLETPREAPICTSTSASASASTSDSPISISSAPASLTIPSTVSVGAKSAEATTPAVPPPAKLAPIQYQECLARHIVDFERAQMTCPGDAIVFVGNLPAAFSDLELSDTLLDMFRSRGPVFVSVRRHQGPKGTMPYAYLQFTNVADARACLSRNKHAYVGLRRLRLAVSNARRHINVAHIDHSYVNEYEAHAVFGRFGLIDNVHHDQQTRGTLIRYRCYGSYNIAQIAISAIIGVLLVVYLPAIFVYWYLGHAEQGRS